MVHASYLVGQFLIVFGKLASESDSYRVRIDRRSWGVKFGVKFGVKVYVESDPEEGRATSNCNACRVLWLMG